MFAIFMLGTMLDTMLGLQHTLPYYLALTVTKFVRILSKISEIVSKSVINQIKPVIMAVLAEFPISNLFRHNGVKNPKKLQKSLNISLKIPKIPVFP